eukprot:2586660-Rhodomonas_salina.2
MENLKNQPKGKRTDPKVSLGAALACLPRVEGSEVRGQGSGVRGQGSRVRVQSSAFSVES